MNQQRSRRFKAIKESKEKAQKEAEILQEMIRMGKEIPPKEDKPHFDSNTITPGTPFMAKVAESLQYYIQERLQTDPGWKGIKVILSDASVPGEGEHKIMDYIRHQRAQPDYDPNTSHVLYGLDADLIMLALATHEPHFFILRETVTLGNDNKCFICGQPGHLASECQGKAKEKGNETDTKEAVRKPFQFLYISVLREYLARDLTPPKNEPLPFNFDLERVIDDFVFLCFFVGNDFLPHLPTLEIRENAIDRMVQIYKKVLSSLGGYLTENGEVDLKRVKVIMEEIGRLENSILVERRQRIQRAKKRERERKKRQRDEEQMFLDMKQEAESGERKRIKRFEEDSPPKANVQQDKAESNSEAAAALKKQLFGKDQPPEKEQSTSAAVPVGDIRSSTAAYKAAIEAHGKPPSDNVEDEIPDDVRLGDPGWKERYYKLKFNVELTNSDFIKNVANEYALGLVWVLRYYYQGCTSWGWFYPFHYAPFAQDMSLIDEDSPKQDLGEPFKPFEQLMGVLPAESGSCLPQKCQVMMRHPQSPIIDFYPSDFALDMNGKRWAWQAVALLPFIDEARLRAAMRECEASFTPQEKNRNRQGHSLIFVHASHPLSPAFKAIGPDTPTTDQSEHDVAYLSSTTSAKDGKEVSVKSSEKGVLEPPAGKKLQIPTDLSGGMSGFLSYTEQYFVPIGGTIQSPLNQFPDIKNNQTYCAFYHFPSFPQDYVFQAKLLPTVTLPTPVLTEEDLMGRRRQLQLSREGVGRVMGHHIRTPSDPGFNSRGSDRHGPYNQNSRDRGDYHRPFRRSYETSYGAERQDSSHRGSYLSRDNYQDQGRGYGSGGDRGRNARNDRYRGGDRYGTERYGGRYDGRAERDNRNTNRHDSHNNSGRGGYYSNEPYRSSQQHYNHPTPTAPYYTQQQQQGVFSAPSHQPYTHPAPTTPYYRHQAALPTYNPYAPPQPNYPPVGAPATHGWPQQQQPVHQPAAATDPQTQAQALLGQLQRLAQMQGLGQQPPH